MAIESLFGKDGTSLYTSNGKRDTSRVCVIGDSIDNDIGAALSCGLASVLVSTGVHKDTLEKHGELTIRQITPNSIGHRIYFPNDEKSISKMFKDIVPSDNHMPTYFLPRFSWWE